MFRITFIYTFILGKNAENVEILIVGLTAQYPCSGELNPATALETWNKEVPECPVSTGRVPGDNEEGNNITFINVKYTKDY